MTDEKAREDFMNDVYNTLDFLPTNNEANRIIDSFDRVTSELEQQPCEDWYDVPSNEMTLEQARQAVKDLRKKLAEYLEQQPCEDAVSRQAVIEQTYNWSKDEFLRITNPFDYLRKRINSLPSVTPKEKTAAWVPIDEEPHEDYECNKCGYAVSTFTANIEPHTEYKYCPNCGARMQEVEGNG